MEHQIHYCRVSDAIVVLDLLPDRYRLLRGSSAERFARLCDGTASSEDLSWGGENGFAIEAIQTQRNANMAPMRAFEDRIAGRVSKRLLFQAIWLQQLYRLRLKRRPLHKILEKLQAKQPFAQVEDGTRCAEIASAFQRTKQIVPTRDLCLPRALAMTDMLFGSGINAQLVFGVTLPFSAHCWVQRRDIVLSDPLDRVRPFTAIMVLG